MNTKNILSISLFVISFAFFVATTSTNESNIIPDCHHCGTISACEEGGQAYGWTDCWYDETAPPPYNCNVHGSDQCGQQT